MALDPTVFQQQFEIFKERIARKSKRPFVSFREGFPLEEEGYKVRVRLTAVERLNASTWKLITVGKGHILKHLISAIEIPTEGPETGNNLVRWRNEYDPPNPAHKALLDAQTEPNICRQIEDWAYYFYRDNVEPGVAFEKLRTLVGSRYDLVAYLFFLKDAQEFAPIASTTFDKAFRALGIEITTARRCSWENYQAYVEALKEIRIALINISGLDDVQMIDAHTFCWLLVRPEMERHDVLVVSSSKGKATNAKIYNAIEKSVYEMVEMTLGTVRNSNGQLVASTKKIKELWMSKSDLSAYVKALLEEQDGRCKLTGIKLQFSGECTDKKLLPSLDRIDSDKHYSEDNLQIVCRFINSWKSDTPDEEFRRLLSLVRDSG